MPVPDHLDDAVGPAAGSARSSGFPLLPLGFSLELMQLLDAVRAQIGLRYPGE